jgi:methylase of polypeptide subunit release factors
MTIAADLMDPPTHAGERFPKRDQALLTLIETLRAERYSFVTPTPATHARVVARADRQRARSLTDVFGWSLPFAADLIAPDMLALLQTAGAVAQDGALLRSKVRVSSLDDGLYLHSAFPTEAQDAVFFGPDSYRYADLIRTELAHCPDRPGARMADIGGGSGVGAIVAAGCCPAARVLMTDINDEALRIARINAAAAGVGIETIACSGLDAVDPPLDVVMLNPPYIIDDAGRAYRDGGGMHGGELSLQLTRQAIERLAPRGRVILYTGSAIVDGRDELKAALEDTATDRGCTLRYRELDPDVFGEELDKPQYADVDRIAVVAAILQRD